MTFMWFAIAFVAGVILSMQAAVNSRLAAGLSNDTVAAVFVSFVGGTLILACFLLMRGGMGAAWSALPGQPAWRYAGGLLGALGVVATVYLVPRIGLVNMIALVIAGQLIGSALLDHNGWLGTAQRALTPLRVTGIAIMAIGVAISLFGDQWLGRLRGE